MLYGTLWFIIKQKKYYPQGRAILKVIIAFFESHLEKGFKWFCEKKVQLLFCCDQGPDRELALGPDWGKDQEQERDRDRNRARGREGNQDQDED